MEQTLTGASLLHSDAKEKQMLFAFSRGGWQSMHLGITGKLHVEASGFFAALLDQKLFPGIGNWMADELLWQSRLHPAIPPEELSETQSQKKLALGTAHRCDMTRSPAAQRRGAPVSAPPPSSH